MATEPKGSPDDAERDANPSEPPPEEHAPSVDESPPAARAATSDPPSGDDRSEAVTASAVFPGESPLDGSTLRSVAATPTGEVAEVVAAARAAQAEWATLAVVDRIHAIAKVKRRILERAEEIADLVHREVGKPIEEVVLAEVLPNADLVDWWCDSIEELVDGTPVDLDPISYPSKRGRIHHDPRGVVALIAPWNYPVAIPLRTLIPALLAGNAVVFKPSEVAPRSGALVASLFADVVPDGLVGLIQGGAEQGRALVAEAVDLVVFTGSVATGKAIAVACAERLVPCSLELGGKDAAIVLGDCRLERTAQGIVWGAFTNAGQNCSAIERVYVEKAIADPLIERIVAITKELREGTDTAVMTTLAGRRVVDEQLDGALSEGAELLTGGKPEDEAALTYPPTVLKLAKTDGALLTEETFGPVLPIVVVDSEDEAIERANESRYALTTSIWTKRIRHGHQLARRLRAGVVTINNHAFTAALPAAPWTGIADTGGGITNSPHALSALTRVRFVLEDRNRGARELWWYPYTPVLRTIAFAMARLRGGAGLFGRLVAFFQLLIAIPKRLLGR
ncbi:MAG: aldehyde dehydrogenase family protein [Deltaproteobacteria bacterium]|nr:aldehyde dehydrogenase family protein [Deltaproteobacteria bacterium]